MSVRTASNLERRYRRERQPLPHIIESPEPDSSHQQAPPEEIGRRIKAARVAAQLTQVALARAVGVSQASLSRWETGREQGTEENQAGLCKVLDVGWDSLYGE